jgi:DNA-binding response OmpR family regulator
MTEAPTVLLVDDSPDTQEMYATFLAHSGYRVLTASNSTDAFTAAQGAVPHVVVTDIVLPGPTDGLELAARLRQDPVTQSSGIIVLSGRTLSSDADRARYAGCDRYLTKPCLPDVLVAEIREVLGHRGIDKP